MKKKIIFLFFILFIIGLLFFLFFERVSLKQSLEFWWRERKLPKPTVIVPTALFSTTEQSSHQVIENSGENKINQETEKSSLPLEINLVVPFVTQAPFKNWDAVHEETCEEAAVLMVDGFYSGVKKYSQQEIEDQLRKMMAWEDQFFGYDKDTTAEETAKILSDFYNIKNVKVYYDITIEDIKKAMADGQPVILPTAGKVLPNPYFKNGGPLYHMLVVKGYTKDEKFITNDPGTNTLGENLTYKYADLYNAIHDWRSDREILKGRKAMIVVEE